MGELVKTFAGVFLFALLSLIFFNGCERDDDGPGHGVTQVAIEPDSAVFEAGDQVQFSVHALNNAGDTVNTENLDIEWNWWSTDPGVFTVEPGGLATGQNSGEAFCVVEVIVLGVNSNFTGRDSAFIMIR